LRPGAFVPHGVRVNARRASLVALLPLLSCRASTPAAPVQSPPPAASLVAPAPAASFTRFAVAADHPEASQAGAEVLAAGGTAADAAAATMLALGVASPASSGLGGGGFALYYRASDHTLTFIDFRETAPAGTRAVDGHALHPGRSSAAHGTHRGCSGRAPRN
jgi:gamma-glutamyltranspeptidase/glutathione hydrolase